MGWFSSLTGAVSDGLDFVADAVTSTVSKTLDIVEDAGEFSVDLVTGKVATDLINTIPGVDIPNPYGDFVNKAYKTSWNVGKKIGSASVAVVTGKAFLDGALATADFLAGLGESPVIESVNSAIDASNIVSVPTIEPGLLSESYLKSFTLAETSTLYSHLEGQATALLGSYSITKKYDISYDYYSSPDADPVFGYGQKTIVKTILSKSDNEKPKTEEALLEEKLEKINVGKKGGEYIEPYKFMSSDLLVNENVNGNGYKKVPQQHKYWSNHFFWVEELKNWCIFDYYYDCPCDVYKDYSETGGRDPFQSDNRLRGFTAFQLCGWNGRDAFVPYVNMYMTNKSDIAPAANLIMQSQAARQQTIIQHRGYFPYFAENPEESFNKYQAEGLSIWRFSSTPCPIQIIHSIILDKTRKYGIIDKETCQTLMTGESVHTNVLSIDVAANDATIRFGSPLGNPAVWRLPTGELVLCTLLIWGGTWQICGGNAADFLNNICKSYFGSGQNKTIKKDWLNPKDPITTNKEIMTGIDNFKNSNTETLTIGLQSQELRRNSDDLCITFEVPTINMFTEEDINEDLIVRY